MVLEKELDLQAAHTQKKNDTSKYDPSDTSFNKTIPFPRMPHCSEMPVPMSLWGCYHSNHHNESAGPHWRLSSDTYPEKRREDHLAVVDSRKIKIPASENITSEHSNLKFEVLFRLSNSRRKFPGELFASLLYLTIASMSQPLSRYSEADSEMGKINIVFENPLCKEER